MRWRHYQTEPPHPGTKSKSGPDQPSANIALLAGNGIVVVDLDGPGAEALLVEHDIVLPEDAAREDRPISAMDTSQRPADPSCDTFMWRSAAGFKV